MNGGTVISHGFRAQLQNLDSLTKHSKTWNQLLERAYAINSWANLATFLRHMGPYPFLVFTFATDPIWHTGDTLFRKSIFDKNLDVCVVFSSLIDQNPSSTTLSWS